MADRFLNENKEMQLLTQKYVEKLTNIWVTMFDDESCRGNLRKLVDHAKDFYNDLVNESLTRRCSLENDIKELQKEADELKRLLHVDIQLPSYNSGEVPLLVVQCEMDHRLESLREQLEERREQIRELLLEQEALCEELGEPNCALPEDPLPSAEDIGAFRCRLDNLREEKVLRLEKVTAMRRDIKEFLQILDLKLNSEAEDRLLNHRQIKLDKDTFVGLQCMYDSYGGQVQELRETIENMRKKLETLWERLDASPNTREKFRRYIDYNQNTYDVIYAELRRCETLKSQNIKLYVQQIREEIREWWDKTLKSEIQRSRFSNFHSTCFNDDLLELHELELEDLKLYYETNRQIFELYADRNMLWDRMTALEAKSSEPGRYNNRGGQLLKEEKERKTIATKLPKIEQKIYDLVSKYEARENKPFRVYGENIIDVMASQWEEKRLQKEKLSSARKNATKASASKSNTPLPANSIMKRTPMSLKNASSMLTLKKTPSTMTLLAPTAAVTTGQKRKLPPQEKVTPLAKRSLMHAFNSPSLFVKPSTSRNINAAGGKTATAAAVPHFKSPHLKNKVISSTIRQQRRSGRYSGGGKKRRSLPKSNAGSKLPMKPPIPKIVINEYSTDEGGATATGADDTYDSFERCIQPYSRSSIVQNQTNTVVKRVCVNENKYSSKQWQHNNNNNNNNITLKRTPSKLNVLHHSTNISHMGRTGVYERDSAAPHSPAPGTSSRKLTTKNLPIII